MDPIVPDSRITLDTGFFGKNVIVLTFQVAHNLSERCFIVDLVSEARRVDDRQRYTRAFLIQLEL